MNRTKIVSQGMVRRLDALSQAAVDFCKVLVDGSTDRDGQELKNVLDRGVERSLLRPGRVVLKKSGRCKKRNLEILWYSIR